MLYNGKRHQQSYQSLMFMCAGTVVATQRHVCVVHVGVCRHPASASTTLIAASQPGNSLPHLHRRACRIAQHSTAYAAQHPHCVVLVMLGTALACVGTGCMYICMCMYMQAITITLQRHPSIWIISLLVFLALATGGILGVVFVAANETQQRRLAAEGEAGGLGQSRTTCGVQTHKHACTHTCTHIVQRVVVAFVHQVPGAQCWWWSMGGACQEASRSASWR